MGPAAALHQEVPVGIGLVRDFFLPYIGKVSCRAAVINLFDRVYLIRAGDVDVNTASYGPRRAGYLGITVPLGLGHSIAGQGVPSRSVPLQRQA